MIRAKCDLSIELERPDRRYAPGDRITGLVRVSVDAQTKCDALTLTRQWRTHGKGNRASGPEDAISLFSGEWKPGTYTYAFDVACPEGPPTYHGRILNVDWYLDARADVPWAIDAKTSTDVFVEPRPGVETEINVIRAAASSAMVGLIFGLFMIPFVLVGLGVLGAGLVEGDVALIGFGAFWLVILSGFIALIVKQRLARQAFKRLDTALERVAPDRVAVVVDYASDKVINAVLAKLVVMEVVVRGSGTDKTTYRETIYQAIQPIPSPLTTAITP